MWGRISCGIILLCFFSISDLDYNRYPVRFCFVHSWDQIALSPYKRCSMISSDEHNPGSVDWSFTLGGMHLENWKETPSLESHLLALGTISAQYRKKMGSFAFETNGGLELGALVSSPVKMEKSADRANFKIGFHFGPGSNTLSVTGRTDTQLLPGYTFTTNDSTGHEYQIKNTAFLSPASLYFSYGYSYAVEKKAKARIDLGLAGGRADLFVDQSIYTLQDKNIMYGVKLGRYVSASYNINFRYEIERNFGEHIQWKSSGMLNVREPYGAYENFWQQADFEIRNTLLLLSGKRVKTKIENILRYDPLMDKSLQLRHSISVGFGR